MRHVSFHNKSTTVRLITESPSGKQAKRKRPSVPRWVRGGVGAIQTFAPELVGEGAARLFFRTQRLPERREDALVMARGAKLSVPFEGEELRAWSWGTGPTVVLSHGWNGRASQLAPFVAPLGELGLRVVAFDHVGHGESSGSASNIAQMARATAAVVEASGGASGLVAHSLGAAAATLAASEGLEVDRIVLVSPPIAPEPWFDELVRQLGLDAPAAAIAKRRVEERVGRRMADLYGPDLARGLSTPALIVHDRDDREVPIACGELLHHAWRGSRLLVTAGLGHRRILASSDVHGSVGRFITGDEPTIPIR